MDIKVEVKVVGVTTVTLPVILLVNETFPFGYKSNLLPVKFNTPLPIVVDDILSNTGPLSAEI